MPKSTKEALFGALRGKCPKAKHPKGPFRTKITMGPKMITHTFLFYGKLISQLHRTSVTQGFLA